MTEVPDYNFNACFSEIAYGEFKDTAIFFSWSGPAFILQVFFNQEYDTVDFVAVLKGRGNELKLLSIIFLFTYSICTINLLEVVLSA